MQKNIPFMVGGSLMVLLGMLIARTFFKPVTPINRSQKQYCVAILTPISVPALDSIERGVKETLESSKAAGYQFETFNANGDRTLMNSYAQKITQGSFDAIVTLGSSATQIMYEVSSKRKSSTPIIFTAVETPVELGIIAREKSSGNHVTGVSEIIDVHAQLKALKILKPEITTLAIAYNPSTHGLQVIKGQIEKECMTAGIVLKPIEIFHTNELSQKIPSGIAGCQALMFMKDVTVASGIDVLVKLCNRHGVTLMASDLDSGDRGAAIAHGTLEYVFGKRAALKVQEILEHGKTPSQVPVEPNDGFAIVINSNTAAAQGLVFTERERFILEKCTQATAEKKS